MKPRRTPETDQTSKEFVSPVKNSSELMIYLVMVGVCVLFVGLTFGYLFGKSQADWSSFPLPKVFWLSTIILFASTISFKYMSNAYLNDRITELKIGLGVSLALGIAFLMSQISGWQQLMAMDVGLDDHPAGSYLYLLSGLHGVHVLAGIVFLGFSLRTVIKHTGDNVKALLFFADPARKSRLKMLSFYWYVVDGLWLYLFLFFLFHHS